MPKREPPSTPKPELPEREIRVPEEGVTNYPANNCWQLCVIAFQLADMADKLQWMDDSRPDQLEQIIKDLREQSMIVWTRAGDRMIDQLSYT